jgi:hypothetical protein
LKNQRQHKGKRDFPFETLLVFLWPKLLTNNRQNGNHSSPKQDGFFGVGALIARCVFVATKPKNNLAQTLKFLERKSSQLGF